MFFLFTRQYFAKYFGILKIEGSVKEIRITVITLRKDIEPIYIFVNFTKDCNYIKYLYIYIDWYKRKIF